MNVPLDSKAVESFQQIIYDYYKEHRRDFAWRNTCDPYHIVVSEIMLQQTQTYRVEPKFEAFIIRFPSFESLACASFKDVLLLWKGLGYNRRALALHTIAQKVVNECNGTLPDNPITLETFPGIGYATARSVCAFAFNQPNPFIETNIRAVYLYFFFPGKDNITDKQLMPFVEQTVDHENAREWYYALMDYGVMLKKNYVNPSRKSAHHAVQSKFQGSDRQIRGLILAALLQKSATEDLIIAALNKEPDRVKRIIAQLEKDQLIIKDKKEYSIRS